MTKCRCLLALVSSFLIGGHLFSDAADPTTISCLTGWTGDTEQAIPKEWMNDGYCDCPFDGKDEPETNACSGSLSWPGVDAISSDSPTTQSNFACPKQPDLILPLSRLHDGICDCCDGSDEDPKHSPNGLSSSGEGTNPCPDDCERVLKAERERLAKIQNDFLLGSRKRDMELQKFATLRKKKIAQATNMERQMEEYDAQIKDIEETKIVQLKETYVSNRIGTMKHHVAGSPMATSLLSSLTIEELKDFIVHLCQIAGEIATFDGNDDGQNTCLALRVAALDLGLIWGENDDYDNGTTATYYTTISDAKDIVNVVFQNAIEAKENDSSGIPTLRWNMSKKKGISKGRRRLDEDFDIDDDYMGQNGYPMDDDVGYDIDDYEERNNREDVSNDDSEEGSAESSGKATFIDEIKSSQFSITRVRFLKESQDIIDETTKILESTKEDQKNDTDGGNETDEAESSSENENTQQEDRTEAPIDSASATALLEKLRRKKNIIERGFHWGASARLLLPSATNEPPVPQLEILQRLVIGTIYYGQVSAVQTWQVLQAILPEYKAMSQDQVEEQTCASPWAGFCPPKPLQRVDGESTFEYPPQYLIDVATAFCDKEASSFASFGGSAFLACQKYSSENSRKVINLLVSLPAEINDFGYTFPTKRNSETDPFRTMFEAITNLPIDSEGLRSLEDSRDEKEKEHRKLSKDVETAWKDAGGKDGNDLGQDGELSSIADKCFDILAGKYTYEVCLFGKAQQKEGKGSGTNLGRWKNIEYNEDGTRVLKWDNGAKCWNGPKRSATVHMKCGSEHKIVSADEPDTCRYVFEMESYLACDDAYKRKMGL